MSVYHQALGGLVLVDLGRTPYNSRSFLTAYSDTTSYRWQPCNALVAIFEVRRPILMAAIYTSARRAMTYDVYLCSATNSVLKTIGIIISLASRSSRV